MTFPELVDAWLTPPRFPAPSFPLEPERFRLRLPERPLPGFVFTNQPKALGAGTEIQCYHWPGAGPTLLLAHGWGGNAAQFSAWIKALLGAGFCVLAYDAPGHGESEGTFSSAPASAAALKVLAEWFAKPLSGIIAHSLGAIATTLALAEGIQSQQVFFLAPTCFVMDDLVSASRQHGLRPEQEEALVRHFTDNFSADLTVLSALQRITSPPPLTIFHDRADASVPFAEAEQVQAHWPGARLIEVPRVGHTRILLSKTIIQQTLICLTQEYGSQTP